MPIRRFIPASAACLGLASALAACSDPKTPSREVFRTALEPLVKDRFCYPIEVMRYEIEGQGKPDVFPIVTSPVPLLTGPGSDGKSVVILDGLAKLGLATRTEAELSAKWRDDGPFERQKILSYTPTEKGAPYLRAVERKATKGTVQVASFCTARAEIVDVVRWTEPTDLFGHRVTQVTYTYRGVDPIPDMPAEDKVQLAEPREATVPFELQSDGWRPMAR